MNLSSNDLNTRQCPLIQYGCEQHQEEHYISEQHQKTLATVAENIFENAKVASDIENISGELGTCFDNCQEKLLTTLDTVDETKDTLEQIDRNLIRLENEQSELDEGINDAKTRSTIETFHIDGLVLNQDVLTQEIKAIKHQVDYEGRQTKHRVLDGTHLWKISAVQEKIHDAQSERQTSIYSPAVYTSDCGYKVCMRLYLNGDGTARGTHMSIFLVILRGSYDSLLKWPFSYRVTFCLYDQRTLMESDKNKQPKHVIESFRPDTRSASFQRPTSTMNIASGIPKFFSLANLDRTAERNRYIINDTMFIKVFIDFTGLPTSMTPFIFSFNMALPVNVQQKLINDELKRREQQNTT
ncbi:unnamed protein product [Adineta ricciae]|uniref:MATH domain-containing protein n=1 Tax=Adineta ricciae TaxID=249248 RepID=A0A815F618_ADIRI|nr:unnamed protein product [Adineta ricciae]CAF1321662.1 unnamed protein product [Adineta ricciae]